MVEFAPASETVGHEQAERRPAVIVSSDYYSTLPNGLVLVVPLTSRDRGLVWQPRLSIKSALVEQVRAISVHRCQHRIKDARLSADDVDAITFLLKRMIAWT